MSSTASPYTRITIAYELLLSPDELAVLQERINAMNDHLARIGDNPDWDATAEARAALCARIDDTLHGKERRA